LASVRPAFIRARSAVGHEPANLPSTSRRIAAAAIPGEVLVSSTVKDIVAGSGISFEERGEQELAGVPGTWRLFAAAQ
jgi:class 3 adenylate cyclase